MNRRTILKGGIALATTAHTAVAVADMASPTPGQASPSIDDFLAKALPIEKARYHAHALAEAMNELSPGAYASWINVEAGFAVVRDTNPGPVKKGEIL